MLQVPILAMDKKIKSNEAEAEYRGASLQVRFIKIAICLMFSDTLVFEESYTTGCPKTVKEFNFSTFCKAFTNY